MYREFWNLNSLPFSVEADRELFFSGVSHRSALHKLSFALDRRDPVTVLLGPLGVGKTHVISHWTKGIEKQARVVRLSFVALSPSDWLAYVAVQLMGMGPGRPLSGDEALRQIELSLRETTRHGKSTVIVVDDAHRFENLDSFRFFESLMGLHQPGEIELCLVLAGAPELFGMLRRSPGLDQRAAIRSVILPFDLPGTTAYIGHRMEAAGCRQPIFSRESIRSISQLSQGIPRRIHQLCDLSLLIGFSDGAERIEASHVEAVAEELCLSSRAA